VLSGLQTDGWTHVPIASIENLSDAVLGAGLEATQMSRAPVTGSLAFATHDGAMFATGSIDGRVAITGSLSKDMITLGAGIVLTPGSRQWLNEVESGNVGVFLPGDGHDAIYGPGSIYIAVTLSGERLEAIAADNDLVLDHRTLGGSGISRRKLLEADLPALERQFRSIHARHDAVGTNPAVVGAHLLDAFVAHLSRQPRPVLGGTDPRGHARIVARARAFIHANLDKPLSIAMIANAAATSLRTLNRAFQAVLGETPYSYVMKLRLHRIRHELVSGAELACTVTVAAHRWGIEETGRFAGWYREHFGELPSQTLARQHRAPAG
jgi:AraC-like DNA-binding protein